MTKKLKKVYMPKWVMWFVLLMIVPILLIVEYQTLFGGEKNVLIGVGVGIMLVAIVAMVILMGYRKLPYFLIED